ncbi:MAG TPA: sugar ABC transporter permease [Bacilli bacterium]
MSQTIVAANVGKPPKRPFWTERRRTASTAYLYISPFFILFLIFGVYPIFFTFYLSFFKWNAISPMKYVGFQNFALIFEDPTFWVSLMNTILMGIMGTVPQLIVALLLAVALNSAIVRFKNFFRIVYFLPNITSIVAVTLVFSVIFSNQGMANMLLDWLGVTTDVAWNSGWWGVKIAIAVMIFWRWTGYNAIIYLAGLQSISPELYEAAKIDGANSRDALFKITIPLLKPFILFTILTSTIGSLQLFTEPFVFLGTSGTGATRPEGITMVIYLYREAFTNSYFGTAAATAVVLFLFTIIFSLINLMITNRLGSSGSSLGGAK